MRRLFGSLLLSLALSLAACEGEDYALGVDEPIFLHNAELKKGALPGAAAVQGEPPSAPQVTSLQLGFGAINPGTPNLIVRGRTSADAYSIGVRLLSLGTGYWVQPVGAEDPTNPGELEFEVSFDAASALTAGRHTLAVVAFDERGRPGAQFPLEVCVASPIPDNLNACNPTREPPPAVATLSWNADADVDLIVVAPDGRRYDRSNRQLLRDGKVGYGLDADGVTGCLLDGRRHESFVWNEPPSGTFLAYANLFDACGRAAVTFTLTVRRAVANGDGTFSLREEQAVTGQFVRAQANGGAGNPVYLSAIQF